jgi:menaquinone-dependent protoporphyrinogen oxidase
MINLKDGAAEPGLEPVAAAIVAGSIHMGRHDAALGSFLLQHGPLLRSVPSAFLCVSLSAASKDPADLAAVDEITQRFLFEAGWHPDVVEHVAGAVRDSRLGLFDRFTVHAVMMEKEIPSDSSGETELTDWAKLDRFIADFARRVPA